ncbi:hypothetical protein GCM10010965_22790 [Caldalkalibacillus thermarum]|uniref:hypothetical protein n=1 Tax=Caldalkalibacillus thermarum TaxID=296745 RepID=UPI001663984B|nr:hypothetical protein [Caldalkalibacillus thermarum]GGK29386.1 hypothetical protein GCM10010965_22790 [Caldalkalibacillus thermarum]
MHRPFPAHPHPHGEEMRYPHAYGEEIRQQQPHVGPQLQPPFFPGIPGVPSFPDGDLHRRVRRLESEVDRLMRRVDSLDRRVRRLEGVHTPWGE